MDSFLFKLLLIFALLLISLLFGLLPIKLLNFLRQRAASANTVHSKWPSRLLCFMSCFTGGVFLGTCFLHLLPDVIEDVEKVRANFNLDVHYPIAELISCLGFFLVFLIEELVLLCFGGGGHHHGHSHGSHTSIVYDQASSPGGVHNGEQKGLVKKTASVNKNVHNVESCENARNNSMEMCAVVAGQDTSKAEPECCEGPCAGRDEAPPILMQRRPHAHSHGVRSVTLVLALSLHSLIEGVALGVQNGNDAALKLFMALIMHKCIVLFSTGIQLARTHAHNLGTVVLAIILLSAMSPIGAIMGVAVEQSSLHAEWKDVVVTILEGLSVGTFLYVTFFEVLVHERDNEHNNLLKLLASLVGFSFIAALSAIGTHPSHAHSIAPPFANASLHDSNMTTLLLY